MQVRVRELQWGDFEEIVRTYYRLYDERDAGELHGITLSASKPSLADEVSWFASLFRQVLAGEAIVSVAEVGGRAVGHCSIRRVGRTVDSENAHVGELGIVVDRDHRGRGVGSALLRDALRRARRNFSVVRLWVFGSNTGAKRLYVRFGFRPAGVVPRAIRRGREEIDDELMFVPLDRQPRRPKG